MTRAAPAEGVVTIPVNVTAREETSAELAQSAVRGTLWLTVLSGSVNASSLIVFVVLGRLLDPAQFGLVAAASVIVLFLRTLVDGGVSRALIQRFTLDSEIIDTAFWLSLGVGAVLTALNFLCAPLTARLFDQPGLTPVVQALSPLIMIAALDRTQSALLDRQMNFKAQAVRSFYAAAVSSVVAIALAFLGAGVYSLVIQTLVFEATSPIFLWRLATWRPKWRFSRSHLRSLLSFGGKNTTIQLLGYLSGNVDNLLIGAFLGPVPLGIYVVGYRMLNVFDDLLSTTLRRVALPAFSRLQREPDAMNNALTRVTGLSAAIVLPVAAGIACVAPNLVPAVFGERWVDSARVMQALAPAAVMLAATTPLRTFAIAAGKLTNELWWSVGFTVAELAGFLAASQWNVAAVAATLSAVSLLYWPLRVLSLRRLVGLQPERYWIPWIKPLVATAVMVVATIAAGFVGSSLGSRWLALLVQVTTGGFYYIVGLSLIDKSIIRDVVGMVRMAGPNQQSTQVSPGVADAK